MTWECACGITNSTKNDTCAGCGWTRDRSERHKRGEVSTPDKAESYKAALERAEQEMSFFRRGALIALIMGIILGVIIFSVDMDLGGPLFYLIMIGIVVCIIVGLACTKGILYADDQYNEAISKNKDQHESTVVPIQEYTSIRKIAPTSGLNIKRRLVGLLFGAAVPISLMIDILLDDHLVKQYITDWRYLLYLAIIFGLVGFLFGDKYYDTIIKFWRCVHKN